MALARATEMCMGDAKPQDLANAAWAFATLGWPDELLFGIVARVMRLCVGHSNAQNLANTVWAFSMVGEPVAALLDPILVLDIMEV